MPSVDLSDWGLGERPLGDEESRWRSYSATVEQLKALPLVEKNRALSKLLERLSASNVANGEYPDLELLDWSQARAMLHSGLIEFGSHGVDHEILARLENGDVEREVRQSCADIAHEVGSSVRVFAFPNGRRIDFDERALEALHSCGVRCAFSTEPGPIRAGDDPFALRRIGVGANMSYGLFVLACCGVLERLRSLAGR